MLHLVTNSVVHLPVILGPVVVTGPHSQIGHRGTWSNVIIKQFPSLSSVQPTLSTVSSREDGVSVQDGAATNEFRNAGF